MHPDDEVLAAVALGDEDVAPTDRRHVDHCADCGTTVDELRRVGALLRTEAETQGGGAVVRPVPDRVWRRVRAATVDETVGARVPGPGSGTADSGPGRRRTVVAGVAAASLLVGVAVGWSVRRPESPAPPAETTVATARLDALDERTPLGRAEIVRASGADSLRVQVDPLDAAGGYLEVWLLNRDGLRMVSLGVLRDDGRASFPVTTALVDEGYVVVDISREAFDDRPAHSGVSLARGTLGG